MQTFLYAYILMALVSNIVSQIFSDVIGTKLTPTDPPYGILFMVNLLILAETRALVNTTMWLAIIGSILLLTVRFGIVRHLVGYDSKEYYANWSRYLAIAINCFGVVAIVFFILGIDI